MENLLRIGQLKAHPPDAGEIGQLLAAAQRNLGDARVKGLSPESRFDIAYKTIMQAALAALMAHGYRPAQSDYTGADVDESSADACILAAEKLLRDVRKWLKENRPNLNVGT